MPYSFTGHLRLHWLQKISEPLECTWLRADPVKIDLPQFERGVFLGELIEDRLKNGGKWSHSNTSAHKQTNFMGEYIFTSRPKWSIHRYTEIVVYVASNILHPHATYYTLVQLEYYKGILTKLCSS